MLNGYLFFNGIVYIISEFNLANSQNGIKETKMHILSTHYQVLLETQTKISDTAYHLTISNDKIMKILEVAPDASPQRKMSLENNYINSYHSLILFSKKRGFYNITLFSQTIESFIELINPLNLGMI